MKLLIALTLIATAMAVQEPIILSKAALSNVEGVLPDVQPINLPAAESPVEEIIAIELIDISPVFVPAEVVEAVRLAQLAESNPEAVNFVNNADEILADTPNSAVHVEASVFNPEAVNFVNNAEEFPVDTPNDAVHVEAPFFYGIVPIEALRFTKPLQTEQNPEVVRIVDIAENPALVAETVHIVESVEALPSAEISNPVETVQVVDKADAIRDAVREKIAAGELETIRIAFPIPTAENQEQPEAVQIVDTPFRRPGKVYVNPLLR